jgi:hypothetical protein
MATLIPQQQDRHLLSSITVGPDQRSTFNKEDA